MNLDTIFITLMLLVAFIQANEKPNIIFILADDLGWNDVGFHGSKQVPTPNLDSLAYDGVILGSYYVQPLCSPTRGAIMTGKHPIHLGFQHWVLQSSEPWGLPLNEKIMPQYFKEMGYSTHIIGKWHLGFFAKEYTPLYRGFDSHLGYYTACEDYFDHTYCACRGTTSWKDLSGLDFHKNGQPLKTESGVYSTEIFNDEALDIIDNQNASQPLFLYLPFQNCHSANPWQPLQAADKYKRNMGHIHDEKRKIFAACVSALDDAVGNITTKLRDRGMLQNSIIVFSTDNGGAANGYNMNMANNWPLRGTKEGLWEGGVRGTGFIWSPLLDKSHYVSSAMMQVHDWLPTLLSASGYDLSKLPHNLDGMDMWSSLSQDKPSPRTDMVHNIDPIEETWAVRMGDYKLISGKSGATYAWQDWYPQPDASNKSRPVDYSARDFPSRITPVLNSIGRNTTQGSPLVLECGSIPMNASRQCMVDWAPCLYDVVQDPCEFKNLAGEQPDVLERLMHRFEEFKETAIPPGNVPADERGFPVNNKGLWAPWVEL